MVNGRRLGLAQDGGMHHEPSWSAVSGGLYDSGHAGRYSGERATSGADSAAVDLKGPGSTLTTTTTYLDLTSLPSHLYTPASGLGLYPNSSSTSTHAQPQHPILEPVLYISGLDPRLTDTEIARGFAACLPVRIRMNREGLEEGGSGIHAEGCVEFQSLDSARRAYATLQDYTYHDDYSSPMKLRYSNEVDEDALLQSSSTAHVSFTSGGQHRSKDEIYDLFDRFGPVARVFANPGLDPLTGLTYVSGHVVYFEYGHAQEAERVLGDFIRESAMLSAYPSEYYAMRYPVQGYGRPFYPDIYGSMNAHHHHPQSLESYALAQSGHSNGHHHHHHSYSQSFLAPQLPPAGQALQERGIDPRNLFVKNLDPAISSNDLFQQFRPYGRIVSARVMRDEETGHSRGFGFVSYQQPREAAVALSAMNGYVLGGKSLVVRLHEPKAGKLSKRPVGLGGHGQQASLGYNDFNGTVEARRVPSSSTGLVSASSSTSTSASVVTSATPPQSEASLDSTPASSQVAPPPKLQRRTSNSYFRAAIAAQGSGSTSSTMDNLDLDDLQAMSPKMRKEVLSGRVLRAVLDLDLARTGGSAFGWVREDEDGSKMVKLVDVLTQIRLGHLIDVLQNKDELRAKVMEANQSMKEDQDLVPSFNALQIMTPDAPAPHHKPAPLPKSEHQRLEEAIIKVYTGPPTDLAETTELITSLGKSDRAKCIFNPDFLQEKLDLAAQILADQRGGGEIVEVHSPDGAVGAMAMSEGTGTRTLPLTSDHLSTEQLALLSAQEAVEVLLQRHHVEMRDDVSRVQAWIDSLDTEGSAGLSLRQKKQIVGERLFKQIKTFGLPSTQSLTITLLDTEDLRSLALLQLFPAVFEIKCRMANEARAAKQST